MTKDEKEELLSCIDNEGFDYAFYHYSLFEDIKDEHFHHLRVKFLEARKELANYIDCEI